MRRHAISGLAVLVAALVVAPATAFPQAQFKIPFKFKAAGKSAPAGEYRVSVAGEGKLMLVQVETGKELELPVIEKLAAAEPSGAPEPRLVFDEVGDFAPSYTEYITVYVLAQVWLTPQQGYVIHVTKGAHNTKTVAGAKVPK